MANQSGMTVNFDDFNKKFFKLTIRQIPADFVKAVGLVIGDIIADAIKIEPRAPHKTGHMWRSQEIELPKWTGKQLDSIFGFDTPYAAKLHEGMIGWNWTLPGSGPKFLEAKLARFKDKYMLKITEIVKSTGTIRDIK